MTLQLADALLLNAGPVGLDATAAAATRPLMIEPWIPTVPDVVVHDYGARLDANGAAAAAIAKSHAKPKGFDDQLRDVGSAAVLRLRAAIAAAEGRHEEALQLQAQAVEASKDADDNEPPMLATGPRLGLGELQPYAGRALAAQGRPSQARAPQKPLKQAWPLADAALLARRKCTVSLCAAHIGRCEQASAG